MEAQNNAIRSNHIKVRIDKTQQNSKCRLCGDRDETINQIISERNKLALKEYKTRHDRVGKVIHWEMCKKYMHNQAPILENDTQKLLWDFDIHTVNLISARRPDLMIINKKLGQITRSSDRQQPQIPKKNLSNIGLAVPADHRFKLKESEKRDKYLGPVRELKINYGS